MSSWFTSFQEFSWIVFGPSIAITLAVMMCSAVFMGIISIFLRLQAIWGKGK